MTISPSEYDVIVVGAGPAGLAATARAASGGLRVALVDAGSRPGGQYWRQPAGAAVKNVGPHQRNAEAPFRRLTQAINKHIAAGRVTYHANHHVWTIERTGEHFRVHALEGPRVSPPGTATAREHHLTGRRLILATGAYDRQVPFPGWTLPGVLTAGGAQALLKGHGVVAGKRILVAGTGPFLLPVAAGLAEAGAHVVGVHEAASPAAWLRHIPAVAANPAKIREGMGYAKVLARHRVPVRTRSTVVSAHGAQSLEAVTVARSNREGGTTAGSERRIGVDTLAVGWGFTPQLELALALRCETRVDTDGSLVCSVDDSQQSSVPGVYVAGESCGVGGAALAVVEGAIAGTAATGAPVDPTLRRRREASRRFARALHLSHPVPPGWMSRLDGDTVICRCEEVTAEQIRNVVENDDAQNARAAKLLVRTGMGWCQGRVCGYATACLTSHWSGQPYDPHSMATRPVAVPVALGTLAATFDSSAGIPIASVHPESGISG